MKNTKRLTCALATLAIVMCTYVPTRAEYLGILSRDLDWTLEITNATIAPSSVTVYYLDKRGLDVIRTMTVQGTNAVSETFPKPGQNVRRVIIEIDPSLGAQATVRINGGGAATIDKGTRLVFDTV